LEKLYYSDLESPLGEIWAAISTKGLVKLSFPCREENFLKELEKLINDEPEYKPSKLTQLDFWLKNYFKGNNLPYTEPFRLIGTGFQKKIWQEIFKIPYGNLTSYGRIARDICKANASRAVGNAVGANSIAIIIPCHRVICTDGGIGGFGGGLDIKRYLLKLEGVIPESQGKMEKSVDLTQFFFDRRR
jgi:O-6-methylguanine DNA methyltransferase